MLLSEIVNPYITLFFYLGGLGLINISLHVDYYYVHQKTVCSLSQQTSHTMTRKTPLQQQFDSE